MGYIIDIICQFVGIDLFQLLPEEFVGLFRLALTNKDFSFKIESLQTIDSLNACLIFSGGFVVVLGQCLSRLVEQGADGIRIVFQSQFYGRLCLIIAAVEMVIVGNVGQVISIHIGWMP